MPFLRLLSVALLRRLWHSTSAAQAHTPACPQRLQRLRCSGGNALEDQPIGSGHEVPPVAERKATSPGCGSTSRRTTRASTWDTSGAPPASKLAEIEFTDETPSGWQEAPWSIPVAVTAWRTTSSPTTRATAASAFSPGVPPRPSGAAADRPLTAPAGGNGVYRYGACGFPDQTLELIELLGRRHLRADAGGDGRPPQMTKRQRPRPTRPASPARHGRRRRSTSRRPATVYGRTVPLRNDVRHRGARRGDLRRRRRARRR